jgi:hypothetical protein
MPSPPPTQPPTTTDELSPAAHAAVARAQAHPLSYGVRTLRAPDRRLLVVAGETHLKLRTAHEIGAQLVDAFDLRGVETFPRKRVFFGRVLGVLIEAPRRLLRALSLGAIRGSTITEARRATRGSTVLLEDAARVPLALHVASLYLSVFFMVAFALFLLQPLDRHIPAGLFNLILWLALLFQYHLLALIPALLLQRQRWSWLLYPAIAILTVRNETMAEGTVAMLAEHPLPRAALVLMGRAHLPGYARELIDKHGFTAID